MNWSALAAGVRFLWIPPAMKSAAKGFCSFCRTRKLCGRTKIIPNWRRGLRLGYGGRERKVEGPRPEKARAARKRESSLTLLLSSSLFVFRHDGAECCSNLCRPGHILAPLE